jgi:hypothetical protein
MPQDASDMSIIFLTSLFIALELFESNWQKSDTLYGVLKNNYLIYKRGMFLYFLMNPTFIYSIFLSIYLNNFGFLMSTIIFLKFADIAFRLHILKKIDNDEEIKDIIPINIKMSNFLRYVNAVMYPAAFLFAIYA